MDISSLSFFCPSVSVWIAKVPPKVLAWIIAHGKMNAWDLGQRRWPFGCLSQPWCAMCKKAAKSSDYLLLHCVKGQILFTESKVS